MNWINLISPRVKHGGCSHFGNGIINPWRVIGDQEYFVFEEGHGFLEIDEAVYPCREGSYIIIPCGKRHISYAESDSVLLHWGHFDWEPDASDRKTAVFME